MFSRLISHLLVISLNVHTYNFNFSIISLEPLHSLLHAVFHMKDLLYVSFVLNVYSTCLRL